MKKWFWLILVLGLMLRLYQIKPALLELVPNRQLIDAKIVLVAYERGWNNLNLHLYGFPFYHWIVANVYKLWGGVNEVAGRWVSVGFSVGAAIIFYKLLLLFGSSRQAVLGLAFFYLFSPVHIIMSRSFLVDELTLLMGIASLYFLARKSFWAGTMMMTLTLLSKFTFGYLLLPALWLTDKKKRLLLLLTLIPVLMWSIYVKHLNEQLIGGLSTGEYNLFYVFNPKNIVSAGFYINIFYHFARYAVTFMWLPLVWLGLVALPRRDKRISFYLWFLGAWIFILFFNNASLTHNYYFLALVPPAAAFAAEASEWLMIHLKPKFGVISQRFFMLMLLMLGLASLVSNDFLVAYRTYPGYQDVPKVSKLVQALTSSGDKLITSAYRTGAVLYFSRREGWELRLGGLTDEQAKEELEKMRRLGAKYYVMYDKKELAGKEEFAQYLDQFPIVLEPDELGVRIYKL